MFQEVIYPDVVMSIPDIAASIAAGDLVGADLEDGFDELDDNITILGARESGIARREKLLGITPAADASLEDRKMEVQARWFTPAIYTENILKRMLSATMPASYYELDVDIASKTITCGLALVAMYMYATVRRMLEEIVPLDYVLNVYQVYKRYDELEPFHYRDLEVWTYEQVRSTLFTVPVVEEVIGG